MSSEAGTRLLIATGEAAADIEELPPLVRRMISEASELYVMTPVFVSRLRWLASDTDRARYEADKRLGVVLGHVKAIAPEAKARVRVGDDTPVTAFADAVREFRPDHILVALRSADHGAWQEQRLIDQIREAFHIPITVFEIDRTGHVPPSTVA